MTILMPEATKAYGNSSLVVLQTVEDPEAVSLATEILAADTVNVSFFLYRGNFSPAGDVSKGEAPARHGDTTVREEMGSTKYSLSDLRYLYDPQGAPTVPANKAKTALTPGTEVFILERLGLSAKNTALAVTQKYRLHHVRLGPQIPVPTGEGEQDEFAINQSVSYVEDPVDGVIAA